LQGIVVLTLKREATPREPDCWSLALERPSSAINEVRVGDQFVLRCHLKDVFGNNVTTEALKPLLSVMFEDGQHAHSCLNIDSVTWDQGSFTAAAKIFAKAESTVKLTASSFPQDEHEDQKTHSHSAKEPLAVRAVTGNPVRIDLQCSSSDLKSETLTCSTREFFPRWSASVVDEFGNPVRVSGTVCVAPSRKRNHDDSSSFRIWAETSPDAQGIMIPVVEGQGSIARVCLAASAMGTWELSYYLQPSLQFPVQKLQVEVKRPTNIVQNIVFVPNVPVGTSLVVGLPAPPVVFGVATEDGEPVPSQFEVGFRVVNPKGEVMNASAVQPTDPTDVLPEVMSQFGSVPAHVRTLTINQNPWMPTIAGKWRAECGWAESRPELERLLLPKEREVVTGVDIDVRSGPATKLVWHNALGLTLAPNCQAASVVLLSDVRICIVDDFGNIAKDEMETELRIKVQWASPSSSSPPLRLRGSQVSDGSLSKRVQHGEWSLSVELESIPAEGKVDLIAESRDGRFRANLQVDVIDDQARLRAQERMKKKEEYKQRMLSQQHSMLNAARCSRSEAVSKAASLRARAEDLMTPFARAMGDAALGPLHIATVKAIRASLQFSHEQKLSSPQRQYNEGREYEQNGWARLVIGVVGSLASVEDAEIARVLSAAVGPRMLQAVIVETRQAEAALPRWSGRLRPRVYVLEQCARVNMSADGSRVQLQPPLSVEGNADFVGFAVNLIALSLDHQHLRQTVFADIFGSTMVFRTKNSATSYRVNATRAGKRCPKLVTVDGWAVSAFTETLRMDGSSFGAPPYRHSKDAREAEHFLQSFDRVLEYLESEEKASAEAEECARKVEAMQRGMEEYRNSTDETKIPQCFVDLRTQEAPERAVEPEPEQPADPRNPKVARHGDLTRHPSTDHREYHRTGSGDGRSQGQGQRGQGQWRPEHAAPSWSGRERERERGPPQQSYRNGSHYSRGNDPPHGQKRPNGDAPEGSQHKRRWDDRR